MKAIASPAASEALMQLVHEIDARLEKIAGTEVSFVLFLWDEEGFRDIGNVDPGVGHAVVQDILLDQGEAPGRQHEPSGRLS